MTATVCELKWLKQLMGVLGVQHPVRMKRMKLYCNSQFVLYVAKNPIFHKDTKHIEVDCHFVRDAIINGLIAHSYVYTKVQLANIFTNALGKAQFEFLLS